MIPPTYCELADLLQGRLVVALSGAGCSTESGIPDYRGPDGPRRDRTPMTYQEFVADAEARQRYWARSAVGWTRVAGARPNAGHQALARLERAGRLRGIITQNVDGLHQAAGSGRVVDLHGRLARVRCLECGRVGSRAAIQRRLLALNPGWRARPSAGAPPDRAVAAPDGDAELSEGAVRGFRVPACDACGGVLKPDVVFFGENVPEPRVIEAWELLEEGEALLVVGSSLTVYSGYRFVAGAARRGIPVAIVNLGITRGDGEASVRVHGRTGEVLPLLADDLLRAGARATTTPGPVVRQRLTAPGAAS